MSREEYSVGDEVLIKASWNTKPLFIGGVIDSELLDGGYFVKINLSGDFPAVYVGLDEIFPIGRELHVSEYRSRH